MEFKTGCSCGHEFLLAGQVFSIWHNECECCGSTYHLEVTCPGCKEILVLQRTGDE